MNFPIDSTKEMETPQVRVEVLRVESGSGGITKSLVLRTAVLLFALGFFSSAVCASTKKQTVQNAGAGQLILRTDPKTGRAFTSWSLFLVCNPYWLAAEKEEDLKDLYASFGFCSMLAAVAWHPKSLAH